jgi:hypothetical protein
MQLPASISLRALLFAVLLGASLGLKAAAGPPPDSVAYQDPARIERTIIAMLQSQNFSTARRTFDFRSTLVIAERGECRLAVRDAKWGNAVSTVYAQDAQAIGPVSYFYRGHRYSEAPGFVVRLGRLEFEAAQRLGIRAPMHVLVAVAQSPSCSGGDFGLADVRV